MNPKQRQFKPKLLPILLVLLQFLSITQAIGGWQTVCIFFNRWSEERGQSTSSSSKGPKSQEERIVPANLSCEEVSDADDESTGGSTKKKKHVGEVSMASRTVPNSSSRDSTSRASAPAFMRGRRSCLDEDDLECISFVGRSPFL